MEKVGRPRKTTLVNKSCTSQLWLWMCWFEQAGHSSSCYLVGALIPLCIGAQWTAVVAVGFILDLVSLMASTVALWMWPHATCAVSDVDLGTWALPVLVGGGRWLFPAPGASSCWEATRAPEAASRCHTSLPAAPSPICQPPTPGLAAASGNAAHWPEESFQGPFPVDRHHQQWTRDTDGLLKPVFPVPFCLSMYPSIHHLSILICGFGISSQSQGLEQDRHRVTPGVPLFFLFEGL